MISEVDEALSALLRAEALDGSGVEVVFDAPTTDWAARRSGPVVDAFLYDIHEDVGLRQMYVRNERGPQNAVTARRAGTRFYRLSYLVTAWTKRPEDEHRLLDRLLVNLVRFDKVPETFLPQPLSGQQVLISTALPPREDRSVTDLWGALGGEMKPSLDVVLTAPLIPEVAIHVGPPVEGVRTELTHTS
jgi:hypothetical protein